MGEPWRIQTTKTDSVYSQMERVLNNFVEKHEGGSNRKSSSISKQRSVLQKVVELRELLKDLKDVALHDGSVYDCADMSLTLTNEDDTTYLAEMDLTCIESSDSETPSALRSILKSGQTQRSESTIRKVRFEDELEETLAEIIENKENLNWTPNVQASKRSAATKNAKNKTTCVSRICRPISIGKTIEAFKILSRNNKPRKSWASCRERSADLKALRDIKTLVEIENERRLNNNNCSVNIKTPEAPPCLSPLTGLRLSLIPDDLDIAGLSWTPNCDLVWESPISTK